jgi:hypothetical protein
MIRGASVRSEGEVEVLLVDAPRKKALLKFEDRLLVALVELPQSAKLGVA